MIQNGDPFTPERSLIEAHTHTHTHTTTGVLAVWIWSPTPAYLHTTYQLIFFLHSVLDAGMTHSKLLVEIPVTLKPSRLENALLCELDAQDNMGSEKMEFLGLSTT